MIYSYILKSDSGFAPNINGEVLTLALCKPRIRKSAKVGDYLIAFNGCEDKQKNGDRIMYIAKIKLKTTLDDYYEICMADEKWKRAKLSTVCKNGDCQYKYREGKYIQLPGCHNASHYERDIGGKYVLYCDDFIYFGRHIEPIPMDLIEMKGGQGHRSEKNEEFKDKFLKYFDFLKNKYQSKIIGDPTINITHCR